MDFETSRPKSVGTTVNYLSAIELASFPGLPCMQTKISKAGLHSLVGLGMRLLSAIMQNSDFLPAVRKLQCQHFGHIIMAFLRDT